MPDDVNNLKISAYYKTGDVLNPVFISATAGDGLLVDYTNPNLKYSLVTGQETIKGWVKFNASGVIQDSYNVSSVTKNSTGNFTVNWTTPFANSSYCVQVSALTPNPLTQNVTAQSTSSCTVAYFGGTATILSILVLLGGAADPTMGFVLAIGDR